MSADRPDICGNRPARAALAKKTLEILNNGEYSHEGKTIPLKEAIDQCVAGSENYTSERLNALREETKPEKNFETVIEVTPETTLVAAKRLRIDENRDSVTCLNFASAKHPGGGFLTGARAQEENLARSSALYPTLIKHEKSYYAANIPTRGGIYTDNLIWSPTVPVFRNDEGDLIPEPYTVSFITAPCVNAGAAKHSSESHDIEMRNTMIRRIDNVLAVALERKQNSLVLGAWGCGAFGNSPKMIAELFETFLTAPDAKYKNVFEKIVFAILVARKADEENLRTFQAVLSPKAESSD